MDYTTGLTDDEFDELLVRLREEGVEGYSGNKTKSVSGASFLVRGRCGWPG